MDQVISVIFGSLFGGKKGLENEKPRTNYEDNSPLPSQCIDINKEHNHNKGVATTIEEDIHGHRRAIIIPPQQKQEQQQHQPRQQKTLLDPLEVYFYFSLTATNSIVSSTNGVKETKELATKVATEESTTTKRKIEKNKSSKNYEDVIVRKIGPYVSTQRILLVGEGDFSFSAALAVAFGYAPNIIATSLDEKVFLMRNYKKSMANIEKLESRGALVIHGVDATMMVNHRSFNGMKFDKIIFNFPHTSSFSRASSGICRNQQLVSEFLRNAKQIIEEDGEIHVTHKTSHAYIKWHIVYLALMEDLNLIEVCPFDPRVFPGYDTKYGHGGDKNFHWFPCNSYKFGLVCLG